MRAAVITAVGSDPVVRDDFPDVTAGPDQVLIAPIASAVNVIDLADRFRDARWPRPPEPTGNRASGSHHKIVIDVQ